VLQTGTARYSWGWTWLPQTARHSWNCLDATELDCQALLGLFRCHRLGLFGISGAELVAKLCGLCVIIVILIYFVQAIRYICECVSTRAALLAAAG
jgi:hypothetical protein